MKDGRFFAWLDTGEIVKVGDDLTHDEAFALADKLPRAYTWLFSEEGLSDLVKEGQKALDYADFDTRR